MLWEGASVAAPSLASGTRLQAHGLPFPHRGFRPRDELRRAFQPAQTGIVKAVKARAGGYEKLLLATKSQLRFSAHLDKADKFPGRLPQVWLSLSDINGQRRQRSLALRAYMGLPSTVEPSGAMSGDQGAEVRRLDPNSSSSSRGPYSFRLVSACNAGLDDPTLRSCTVLLTSNRPPSSHATRGVRLLAIIGVLARSCVSPNPQRSSEASQV